MQTVSISYEHPSGQVALGLAGFFRDPLQQLAPSALNRFLNSVSERMASGKLADVDALADLSQTDEGRAAITRAARQTGAFDTLEPDADTLKNWQVSDGAVAAMRIALAPIPALHNLCLFVGAAAYTTRLRALLMRAERDAAKALFKDAAYEFGVHECQPFYNALAVLDDGAEFTTDGNTDFATHPVGQRAAQVLAAHLSMQNALAGRLVLLRLVGQPDAALPDLSEAQHKQLLRLIDRKGTFQ